MFSSTIIKTRQLIGQSEFNYLRSKAIALHIPLLSLSEKHNPKPLLHKLFSKISIFDRSIAK
jgi:hypothetical protein